MPTKPTFPNESPDYRKARQDLLAAEIELRANGERVAEMRRQLPAGGELKEDYVFDELVNGKVVKTRLSQLFKGGHDTLLIYSFMYSPSMDGACPMCTAYLDGLNGQVGQLGQKISTAVVARHDTDTLASFAKSRNWTGLRLLSSANNSFNVDYLGEVDGGQVPIMHIFRKEGDTVRHFWSSEMVFADAMKGTDPRHLDMTWPLWNVLDVTPEGRGAWYPSM